MIPAFIIARDRLTMIRNTVQQCSRLGCVPIIIDNDSTYPPLLEWYRTDPCGILRLGEEYQEQEPHRNLWKHIFPQWGLDGFKDLWNTEYYVVTDPDLDLSELPVDTIEVLKCGLVQGCVYKCGLSLGLNGIGEEWVKKVIEWENKFWATPVNYGNYQYFEAPIDTTFALYNIYNAFEQKYWDCHCKALRAGYPYCVKHLPWYKGRAEWDEEDQYYYEHMNKSISWTFSNEENYAGTRDVQQSSENATESSI